ncbi:MAG: hypothetical protein AB7S70_03770 [Hyphomicrobium sp.]|uniref:hypothetical protein n=1 Tax=Hyphomicrobium sp. TaxID=82 RepID=UPI003D0A4AFB
MLQDVMQFFVDHPAVTASLAMFALLALIGGWYVVSHHLHSVLVTLLCSAGFVSGIFVLYRGYEQGLLDLQIIGAFLIVIFPLVYHRAIRVAKVAFGGDEPPIARGHARRARV